MPADPRVALAAAILALSAAPAAQAHRSWLYPSSTVLSGAEPWVTVDGAVSNTLFYADHVPMRLDGLKVVGPDGGAVAIENGATGKYRSTFDVRLAQPGTYKIVNSTDNMSASYKLGAETKRWRGPAAGLAAAIPKDATEVKVSSNSRRIETFVTAGAPTTAALKPTGKGLELEAITHPNDLVASEKAKFRMLLDGKPAADVEVEIVLGGVRYREKGPELKVKTAADGAFEISWPEAGLYWMEAESRSADAAGVQRILSYVATLEVLPD
jgi:uncharacterized GH25 family protein